MTLDLQIAYDLARAWEAADARQPMHPRFGPGIGPFEEKPFVRMLHNELLQLRPDDYLSQSDYEVGYLGSRETCDLCVGPPELWEWAVEVKYARMKRSNGDLEEAALSRVLSPYRESAIVDCEKILGFSPARQRAVLIVAYDYPDLPVEPLIEDFETLARKRVWLGDRQAASFAGNVHPHHRRGTMFAWEVRKRLEDALP